MNLNSLFSFTDVIPQREYIFHAVFSVPSVFGFSCDLWCHLVEETNKIDNAVLKSVQGCHLLVIWGKFIILAILVLI